MTFEEQNGKTKLTMRAIFPSVEDCEKTKKFGAVEGGNQTLDRLAEHLVNCKSLAP